MIKTQVSQVIDAPLERVWQTIRPFDSLSQWHPFVAACHMENQQANNTIGGIRAIGLKEGGVVRETLLGLSDTEHRIVYDIIESPMPVENYIASIQLYPVTETNQTFVFWDVVFDTPDDQQQAMIATLQDIFCSGLSQLNELLAAA
ncbi:SRPBCC family protein [Porticoccaceae bacterium]|nr:SRPBCC family protein [Porticoccaceae bacterium]